MKKSFVDFNMIYYDYRKPIKDSILLILNEFPILKSTEIKIDVGHMPHKFRKSFGVTKLKYKVEHPFF